MLKRAFGAPSHLGEQVARRRPGETPLEQTWPVGSLRYHGCLAKITGMKQFYFPCDHFICGLSPIFLFLQMCPSIKTLKIDYYNFSIVIIHIYLYLYK